MAGERVPDRVERQEQTSRGQIQREQTRVSNSCPYFLSSPVDATGLLPPDHSEEKSCHAVLQPFIPSAVHQSSCCLNPANFVRCPYYGDAMGEQKQQRDFQMRKRSLPARLRDRLGRLLPFGRTARKKRRRVYFVV